MFPKKSLKSYRGRGQIYSWLRAHHETVAEGLASEELTWPAVAAEMASHGVSARRGVPPRPNAILKVWRRVCDDLREVEAADVERRSEAEARKARPRLVYPSRISPNWRPQEVPQVSAISVRTAPPMSAPSQALVPARPSGSTPLSPFADTRTKEEIEAHIQEQERKMDEMFAKHDRKYRFGG